MSPRVSVEDAKLRGTVATRVLDLTGLHTSIFAQKNSSNQKKKTRKLKLKLKINKKLKTKTLKKSIFTKNKKLFIYFYLKNI